MRDYSPPEIPILQEHPKEIEKCNKTITIYIPPMKPKHALDNRYDTVFLRRNLVDQSSRVLPHLFSPSC